MPHEGPVGLASTFDPPYNPMDAEMRRTILLTERKPRRVRLAPADVVFLLTIAPRPHRPGA